MTLSAPPGDRLAPKKAEAGRWIAVETAGLYGTVAAAEVTPDACRTVASKALPRDARSAQTLAPALRSLLDGLGWDPASVAAVVVAVGPGSFTGLRVGVATAKTYAYATGAAVIGVDTLDALAEATPLPAEEGTRLWTVLDAQRSELFAASHLVQEGRWVRDDRTQRLAAGTLANFAGQADLVVGPTAEKLPEAGDFRTLNAEPSASAVLRVGWRRWQNGAADNVFALAPEYHRLSAAEEKLVVEND